ncbi:MAG: response regulator [Cyclobacteriaceae bacterium]|nr:response regulator [Cyclobacteriaceae bacterium]
MKHSIPAYVRKGLFYKSVVEDGSDIIFLVDYEGTILYHNHSVRHTLGYKGSSLIGKRFFDFVPDYHLENFKKEFARSTRKAFNKSIEFQFKCADRSYKYLEFNSVNLKQKEGIKGLILDCRDITQRKEDAAELLRAQKAKEQFLANISHEIRTPINGIAGMAALLSQNPSKEEQKTYLNAIKTAADNLKVIINDILDLASIESGKLKFEKIDFSLPDLLHSLLETFGIQAKEKGIKLTYHLDKEVHQVFVGDPVRLNQVLINLISNALKFTHSGSIHIEVFPAKIKNSIYQIQFNITDTGIGIPEDKLQTIFESFSQADASVTRKYGGTGLGLTIVKQLVELQNGSIQVVSKENEGSTFTFTLPYRLSKSKVVNKPNIAKPQNRDQFNQASILLVEDNDINRLYAGSILKMWGCYFETAENGVVALEKIRNQGFDLVLMDIQMPVMDGFETTKAIRKGDAKHSRVPIIALTANATKKDFERCLAAGMNDCIPKPFTQEDLFKVLAKYLGKKINPKNIRQSAIPESVQSSEVDLSYLYKVSNGDKNFIQEITSTFLESTPKTLRDIQEQLQEKNWRQLAKVVHKIKPTITLLGIHALKDKILQLEAEAIRGQDERLILALAEDVHLQLRKAINALALRN